MEKGVPLGVVHVVRETQKAILVEGEDIESDRLWLPKSVIHESSEVFDAQSGDGELVIEDWWAKKEGLL